MSKRLVKRGVFTPWSEILCARCHNTAPTDKSRRVLVDDVEDEADESTIALCDVCAESINVGRTDVALCQKLALAIRYTEASVWQTGGLCVAAGQDFEEQRRQLLGTEGEGEGVEPGTIVIYLLTLDEDHGDITDYSKPPIYEGTDLVAAVRAWEEAADKIIDGAP